MPQINLLKQTRNADSFLAESPKIIVRIFLVILLALAGYYVWLFVDLNKTNNTLAETQSKINADKQKALNIKKRDEILTRQLQLKALAGIINQHTYLSQLMPEVATVTLKKANYHNLSADSSGVLSLDVTVPSIDDMDKYMQVFDLPIFNENFSDIRIGGFNTVQGKDSSSVHFQVSMKFNPAIIQYKASKQ